MSPVQNVRDVTGPYPIDPHPHPVENVILALSSLVTYTESIGCIFYQVTNQ
jgi:hypothetical protein